MAFAFKMIDTSNIKPLFFQLCYKYTTVYTVNCKKQVQENLKTLYGREQTSVCTDTYMKHRPTCNFLDASLCPKSNLHCKKNKKLI